MCRSAACGSSDTPSGSDAPNSQDPGPSQSFDAEPVAEDAVYRLGLQNFHFVNLEEFFSVPLGEIAENGAPRVIATSCREILDEYLSSHQNLDRQVSGRLVVESPEI